MPHPERPDHRCTYLLTLWQEGRTWRAALRPSHGGPRTGFGDLDQLMSFLLRLQDDPDGPPPPGPMPQRRERRARRDRAKDHPEEHATMMTQSTDPRKDSGP